MVLKIEEYKRKAVIGTHGAILEQDYLPYHQASLANSLEDELVWILGTESLGWHFDTLPFITLEDCKAWNNSDISLALYAMNHKIPLVRIASKAGWLKRRQSYNLPPDRTTVDLKSLHFKLDDQRIIIKDLNREKF